MKIFLHSVAYSQKNKYPLIISKIIFVNKRPQNHVLSQKHKKFQKVYIPTL